MLKRRFQILILLLILWQLIVPSGAPWVHTLLDGDRCASVRDELSASVSPAGKSQCGHHYGSRCCAHRHAPAQDGSSPSEEERHDCANCPICHAIAAPRLLVDLVSPPDRVDEAEIVTPAECADPQLGFRLRPKCRAPPRVQPAGNHA